MTAAKTPQNNRVTNLKISTDYPPNYMDIVSILGEDKNAVYCYGDTIYNPNNRTITADVEIHEEVHSKQQGDTPEIWYYKYLHEPQFRLGQEIEAYGVQYAFAKQFAQGSLLEWLKDKMAMALSSETYGNIISYRDAEQAIRNYKQ